jgi:hypothetical protein
MMLSSDGVDFSNVTDAANFLEDLLDESVYYWMAMPEPDTSGMALLPLSV